jgi:hypothetical protein
MTAVAKVAVKHISGPCRRAVAVAVAVAVAHKHPATHEAEWVRPDESVGREEHREAGSSVV